MKAIIATKNAGKIEGALSALQLFFPDAEVVGIPAPSDVSEQPIDGETLLGAKNRVKNLKKYCKENNITADLYLAIESGIVNFYGSHAIANFAVIEDNENFESFGVSPCFPVPDKYVDKIKEIGLGEFMGTIFGKDDERHNHGGGIQLLTHNKLSRIDLNRLAFTVALTRYLNKEWN